MKWQWQPILKAAGLVASILAGAIGSYQASTSTSKTDAKNQATVSYEMVAANQEKLRMAVENLQENEKRLWSLVLQRQQPVSAALLPVPPHPPSGGLSLIGQGSGSGTGQGFGRASASVKAAPIPPKVELKSSPELKPLPKTFDHAVEAYKNMPNQRQLAF